MPADVVAVASPAVVPDGYAVVVAVEPSADVVVAVVASVVAGETVFVSSGFHFSVRPIRAMAAIAKAAPIAASGVGAASSDSTPGMKLTASSTIAAI